jgi:ferritin
VIEVESDVVLRVARVFHQHSSIRSYSLLLCLLTAAALHCFSLLQMRSESDDERSHAMQFVDFANKRDITIHLENLEAPDCKWKSPEDLWEKLLQAEMDNTQYLLAIGDAAANSNDHALTTFLMPFHLVRSTKDKNRSTSDAL